MKKESGKKYECSFIHCLKGRVNMHLVKQTNKKMRSNKIIVKMYKHQFYGI